MAYNTPKELFTGICDAIRKKTGTTGLINHQDIPAKIEMLHVSDDVMIFNITGYVLGSSFSKITLPPSINGKTYGNYITAVGSITHRVDYGNPRQSPGYMCNMVTSVTKGLRNFDYKNAEYEGSTYNDWGGFEVAMGIDYDENDPYILIGIDEDLYRETYDMEYNLTVISSNDIDNKIDSVSAAYIIN